VVNQLLSKQIIFLHTLNLMFIWVRWGQKVKADITPGIFILDLEERFL